MKKKQRRTIEMKGTEANQKELQNADLKNARTQTKT